MDAFSAGSFMSAFFVVLSTLFVVHVFRLVIAHEQGETSLFSLEVEVVVDVVHCGRCGEKNDSKSLWWWLLKIRL